MTITTSRGLTVRAYEPADAPGIRAVLEATYPGNERELALGEWWSFGCPDARSGYQVAECDGRIVGLQPMAIFNYRDAGRMVKGAVLSGVAVHPDYRRRGIFSALLDACEREAWNRDAAFVTSMPNERSLPGFARAGYTDLGRRSLLVHPLRSVALGGTLLPVAGHLAGTVVAALRHLTISSANAAPFTVRPARRFPADLGKLAQAVDQPGHGLGIHRSHAWLSWRYLAAPGRTYDLTEAREPGGRLAGLAVTTTEDRGRLRLAYVMDLLSVGATATASLLASLFARLRDDGVHAVVTVLGGAISRATGIRHAFWKIPGWAPVKRFHTVARFHPDAAVPSRWQSLDGWHVTLGDWDNL